MNIVTWRPQRKKQSGATLLVALVMLVVLTLFAITAINFTNINTRIVGNQQFKKEAESAAQQAIEQIISTDFTTNPLATDVNIDINNDGTSDYIVKIAKPVCLTTKPIQLLELDITIADDQSCFKSAKQTTTGLISSSSGAGNSLCSNTQWDVQATVTDSGATGSSGSGAKAVVHQGIAKRVAVGTPC